MLSFFCSPFSSAEFIAAATHLFSFTTSGPDKIAYPRLKQVSRSGWIFSYTLSIFPGLCIPFLPSKRNLLLSSSITWESLSTLLVLSGLSLTYCVSKLFERIILSCLLFFLESNSILSPRKTGSRPGQSTLYQTLFLSQSILDGFNKPRLGSQTTLATIDFSKAFDHVWHPALFPQTYFGWSPSMLCSLDPIFLF